jgi:hypothetical protein
MIPIYISGLWSPICTLPHPQRSLGAVHVRQKAATKAHVNTITYTHPIHSKRYHTTELDGFLEMMNAPGLVSIVMSLSKFVVSI